VSIGRLALLDGSTVVCDYRFEVSDRGFLRLPEAMFVAHGEQIHGAILDLADGGELRVDVVMGPRVGEASFSVRV